MDTDGSNNTKVLTEQFCACTFAPVTKNESSTSLILRSDMGAYNTTSYYLDSSGRTRFTCHLTLHCRSKEDLDNMLKERILSPAPANVQVDRDDEDDRSLYPPTSTLRLEVRSLTTDGAKLVTVEGTTVKRTSVEGLAILIETEIVVRAATPVPTNTPSPAMKWSMRNINTKPTAAADEVDILATKLEISAVLVTKPQIQTRLPGLLALELGGGGSLSFEPPHQARLKPIELTVQMTSALCVSVRNVSGSSGGSTLVSLTVRHSNTHSEPVTITNIAFHPGHSRPDIIYHKTDQSMPGGQKSVTDMSKFVKWGFVPRTEPQLPLTLLPYDAYSTVLTIVAGEDLRSRSFVSPMSVTAVVGDSQHVLVATDAKWMTGRIAVEPADAFRIDMDVAQKSSYVGAPLVVSLRVLNLSTETRDLMLLMAKDDDKHHSHGTPVRHGNGSVNTAVVSEVNGYTFGVWGLSGDDDGTTRHNRDHELLAVDAALLLGEVKGQHSVDAELRFVPLREGTLDVPNLKLYDKTGGKWYNCIHKLQIVAAAKKTMD